MLRKRNSTQLDIKELFLIPMAKIKILIEGYAKKLLEHADYLIPGHGKMMKVKQGEV